MRQCLDRIRQQVCEQHTLQGVLAFSRLRTTRAMPCGQCCDTLVRIRPWIASSRPPLVCRRSNNKMKNTIVRGRYGTSYVHLFGRPSRWGGSQTLSLFKKGAYDLASPLCSSSFFVAYSTIAGRSSPAANSLFCISNRVSNTASPLRCATLLGLITIVIRKASLPSESMVGSLTTVSTACWLRFELATC
jgi:hypothetical protein